MTEVVPPTFHRSRDRYGASTHKLVRGQPIRKRFGKFWHQLGPGLTTGAADDDPSGIATYSQTGSQFGFQFLWLAPITFPLMAVAQEMCARIGLVTGRGLAANIRNEFPRTLLYICTGLLFTANAFNIGADLGAMTKATQLLFPKVSSGLLIVGFASISLLLQVFLSYARYATYLKGMALVLLAYVITAFTISGIDWGEVLRNTVIPNIQLSRAQILLVCAILGTTISPYLFFWQTSQEVEEEILKGATSVAQRQRDVTPKGIRVMRIDVWVGMFFSNTVMFFIILTSGAVLHTAGVTNIQSAGQAAEALRPLAGQAVFLLFAVGIVGVGLLALPVLAGSAAYAIAESFHWKEGLYRKLKNAYAFYGVLGAAMLVGFVLDFVGLDPIHALIYAAIANGIVAPIVLYFVVSISGRKAVMGSFVNTRFMGVIGWFTVTSMALVAMASLIVLFV